MRLNRRYERQQHVEPIVASAEQPCYHLQPDKGQHWQCSCRETFATKWKWRNAEDTSRLFAKVTPYVRNSKKWEKLTGAVTSCLAKDIMPIYSVEKPGFQQLLKEFDPQYVLPLRKYFSDTAIPTCMLRPVKW